MKTRKRIAGISKRAWGFCRHLTKRLGWLWCLLVLGLILGYLGFWFQEQSNPNSIFPPDQISVTVYVKTSPAHVSVTLYSYLEPQYDTLTVNVTGSDARSDPWILVIQCPAGAGLSSERPVYSEGTSGILLTGNAIISNHNVKNYSHSLGCFKTPTPAAEIVQDQNIDETLPVLEQNPAAQSAQADTPLYVERSQTGKRAIKDLVEVLQPPNSSCQGAGPSPSQPSSVLLPGGTGPGTLSPLRNFISAPSKVTVPCYTPVTPNTAATRYYFPTAVTTSETLENVSLASESVNSMFPPGTITSDDKIKWQGSPDAPLSPSLSATSLSSARNASTDTFIAGLLIGAAVGFFVPFLQGIPEPWRSAWRDSGYLRKRRPLQVELLHDHETGNWHYSVPALSIDGDAATREAALNECRAGITHALESDPRDYEAHVITLELSGAP